MHRLALFALVCAAALTAAACSSSSPATVKRHHGLGGASLVYVENLDTEATTRVGRFSSVTNGEIAAKFRIRLFQTLRNRGMQTRDGTGSIPTDGVLVRGRLDTVDGGSNEGMKVGGQRIHCSIELWNGDESRWTPAYELQISGTPALGDVMTDAAGMAGAAEDAADQVAKFIADHP